MKKLILSMILISCFVFVGCYKAEDTQGILWFSTSAEYPPFEYKTNGSLVGFDVELAQLIAQELGAEAQFKDMQFSTVLLAVQNGMVDAAIATITVTQDRLQNFDFSHVYYVESLAMISQQGQPIHENTSLAGKTIACQLGTTMEYWLKAHAKEAKVVTLDNNPQAIEALKAGHVDGVLIDEIQAAVFTRKNPNLSYSVIAKADSGYAIAFKKGSPLVKEVNKALETLKASGEIERLEKKYFEVASWNSF